MLGYALESNGSKVYGSGDVIRKRIQAKFAILHAIFRIDLFYNPTKYIKIFLVVAE